MPVTQSKTLRRSVALPRQLVEDVLAVAPPTLRNNLNALVITSLRDFLAQRRRQAFEESMAAMAADPAIQSASATINAELESTESVGLPE
jgi:hypothetical protein